MKEKVKLAIMKKEYSVTDYYKETGICQRIARSAIFDNTSLVIITINAIWISVDTDYNTKPTLINAHPVFVFAENFFCGYFVFEVLARFGAFNVKRMCLTDPWFVFDSTMALMMVLETWVMTVMLVLTQAGDGEVNMGDASILKLIRLLRMTRMARMARLLRAMPELMILIKGIMVATRSVFFTLCLLVLIIYVFAVCLTQITDGFEPLHTTYFSTVLDSMNTLLLRGTLPDLADIVNAMGKVNYGFAFVMLFFILMSSLTVMNMLVGVLVEVVSVVSAVEKDQMTMTYVKSMLMSMLEDYDADEDHNMSISKSEFEQLLLKPRAARIIQDVGVDVVGLVDFMDFIFKDGQELSFPEFMDVVLQLRGTNNATVRDVVDLRKFVLGEINHAVNTLTAAVKDLIAPEIGGSGTVNSRESLQVNPSDTMAVRNFSFERSTGEEAVGNFQCPPIPPVAGNSDTTPSATPITTPYTSGQHFHTPMQNSGQDFHMTANSFPGRRMTNKVTMTPTETLTTSSLPRHDAQPGGVSGSPKNRGRSIAAPGRALQGRSTSPVREESLPLPQFPDHLWVEEIRDASSEREDGNRRPRESMGSTESV